MNSSILKMFIPQLLKQAENPELKEKLIRLINDKKQQVLADFLANEKDIEDCKEYAEENFDCVLQISTTRNDLVLRVQIQDKMTSETMDTCGIYRYEDILEAIKTALK